MSTSRLVLAAAVLVFAAHTHAQDLERACLDAMQPATKPQIDPTGAPADIDVDRIAVWVWERELDNCQLYLSLFAPISSSHGRIAWLDKYFRVDANGQAGWNIKANTAAPHIQELAYLAQDFNTFGSRFTLNEVWALHSAAFSDEAIVAELLDPPEPGTPAGETDAKDRFVQPLKEKIQQISLEYLTAFNASRNPNNATTEQQFRDWLKGYFQVGFTGGHWFGLAPFFGLEIYIDEDQISQLLTRMVDVVAVAFPLLSSTFANIGKQILFIMLVLAIISLGWKVLMRDADLSDGLKNLAQVVVIAVIFLYLLTPQDTDNDPSTPDEVFFMSLSQGVFNWFVATPLEAICDPTNRHLIADPSNPSGDPALCANEILDKLTSGDSADGSMASVSSVFGYGSRVALHLIVSPSRAGSYETVLVEEDTTGYKRLLLEIEKAPAYMLVIGISFFCAIIIIVLWLLVACYFMIIWIEGFIIMLVGTFVLGFAVHDWSRDRAIQYIWYCVGWGVRFMTALLVLFLARTSFESAFNEIDFLAGVRGGYHLDVVSFAIYGMLRICEPLFAIFLIHAISNRIGAFFGNQSNAGQSMVNLASRLGAAAMMGVTAGTAAAASGTIGAATTGAKSAIHARRDGMDSRTAGSEGLSAGKNAFSSSAKKGSDAVKNAFSKLHNARKG